MPTVGVGTATGAPGSTATDGTKGLRGRICQLGCPGLLPGPYLDETTLENPQPGKGGRGGCGLLSDLNLDVVTTDTMVFRSFGVGPSGPYTDLPFDKLSDRPPPDDVFVNGDTRVHYGACSTRVNPIPSPMTQAMCTCQVVCDNTQNDVVIGFRVNCNCESEMAFGSAGDCICNQLYQFNGLTVGTG